MTSTSRDPFDITPARLVVSFLALSLAVILVYLMVTYKPVDPKVRLANETVRVDYNDGVSCYHRGDAISCVYVRRTYGPDPLTSWPLEFP